MSKKSISCRVNRVRLVLLFLLCVAVGGTGCTEKTDSPPSSPSPASPAATDSVASARTAQPAPPEPTVETEPASVPEESQTPVTEPAAEPGQEESEPATPEMPEQEPPAIEPQPKLDFGEPLVEGLGKNERLLPKQPIWLTKDGKSVVIQSMVCQNKAPLEMFACLLGSKEHESVLAVPVKASYVHTGLLAAEAVEGTPVSWDPEYTPPTGTEIEITLLWKDEEGKVQKARAQDWVQDMTTGKAMAHPWVFAGSQMIKDEETGKEQYLADITGELICVSNFPSATLDVPIKSSDSNAALMFEAFTEKIPELGTPVTMVLTPKLAAQSDSPQNSD